MSTASTTNVGIRLTLDGVQAVEAGLGRVQSVAQGAAKEFAGLAAGLAGGLFSASAFAGWIKGAIDAADQTDELTQKTGLLAEQVAGLKLAFQFGSAGDQFESSMARLAKEVAAGNKAFALMGVSVKDADGKLRGVRDIFVDVADKFSRYEDGVEKTALAISLFGKSGADLIPVLNGGAKAVEDFDRKARDMGLTISTEMAQAAAKFNDDLDLMKMRLDGLAVVVGGPLVTAFNTLIEKFERGSRAGNSFMSTAFQIYRSNISQFYGGQEIDPYSELRKELDGVKKSLSSGRLNSMQSRAFEEKRAELEGRMAGYLNSTAGGGRGSINPDLVRYRAPIVEDGGGKPKTSRGGSGGSMADQFASEREAAKAWADAYKDFARLAREAQTEALGLSKAQARLVEYLESPAYQNASEPMRQLALEQAYVAINAEQAAQALAKEREELERASNAMADRIEQEQAKAAGYQDQVKTQLEANAAYGLGADALTALEVARLRDAAAEAERQAQIADGIDPRFAEAYREQAKALLELADAKQAGADTKKQTDAYQQMWSGVEGFASNAFMDIAMNGEDAFKRIGESLKREVIQALYEMTVKKWIINFATGGGGGGGIGGGDSWMTQAISAAYKYYAGGAGAAGAGGAAAAGTYEAAAETALQTSNTYAGGTAAGGGGSAASASWMSYAGYAALIYAAVQYAEKLYSQGYNRQALGYGGSSTTRFGNYSSYTSDPSIQKNQFLDKGILNLEAKNQRTLMDAVGMSEKWADIFSGSVRMATLIGRRLTEVGLQADIVDGQASVSGYAKYKGGLFRSNKTVGVEADPRDTAMLKAQVEALQNGTKLMAQAMGYSADAVEHYTGKLKVNFKGVKSNAEASERLQKAMDDLQFSMLKAAAGGKLSREEFDKFMAGVQESIQAAGISAQGLGDIMVNGMMQGLSGEEIGAQLSQMVIGGIYQTIAQQAFAPVANQIMTQLVTPIFTALAAGVPVTEAISKGAIDSIVSYAKASAEAFRIMISSEEFQAAMQQYAEGFAEIGNILAGAGGGIPDFSFQQMDMEAENRARERNQLEREIARLEGRTNDLRQMELQDIDESNRALQLRIWALEDEQAALDKVKELQDAWTGLTDSIEEEINRLRGIVAGESAAGLAYLQARFAITTGQARAMDQDAAAKLPGLSGQLADAYLANSGSRSEYQARVNQLAASLSETNRITRGIAGIDAESAQKVKDEELAKQIELLNKHVEALTAAQAEASKSSAATAKLLTQVTSNGNAMRTVTA